MSAKGEWVSRKGICTGKQDVKNVEEGSIFNSVAQENKISASIKDVLQTTVHGFIWADLDAALKRDFPGGKGRFTLFECKSRGGLD